MSIYPHFVAFVKAYPTAPATRPSETTWSMWCGLCMIQFVAWLGGARQRTDFNDAGKWWKKKWTGDVSSAFRAAMGSGVLTKDHTQAPLGAFHWWDWSGPNNGHVGIDLDGRGTRIGMASTAVANKLGTAIGTISVKAYTYGTYLGWSTGYSGGRPHLPAEVSPVAPTYQEELIPQAQRMSGFIAFWPHGETMRQMQAALARRGRYTGLVDGIGGSLTARGIQITARVGGGYTGPVDGVLGPQTLSAVQRYAQQWGGYQGPIDADPREHSWRGFLAGLENGL
jgi:peptidoglycan hydrolase-like protein with peptidoglycan-binding domain